MVPDRTARYPPNIYIYAAAMTVDLVPAPTDEQAMLVDASVRFMESEHPLATVRRRRRRAYDDVAYRRTAAELGWFGLLADEARGGGSMSGNGVLDAALIAAERGARLQPGPFVGHNVVVACAVVGRMHTTRCSTELVSGRAWATWTCGSERSCTLRADGDGLRLAGSIPVVADVAACTWLLVDAASDDGVAQVLVRTDAPGVTVRALEGLDVTRHWCAVELTDVAVAADDVVAGIGRASRRGSRRCSPPPRWSARWTATSTSRSQYAKDRIAFGRPIGSFQASSTCSPTPASRSR